MVSIPNSLSNNAVMFQKAKSAPQAIAKNIKAPTQKAKPINIPELWDVTDKEVAFLRQAKVQWMDQQWALDYIKEKRKPTTLQSIWQWIKNVAWGIVWWLPALWPTIGWWILKWLWSIPVAPWMDLPKTPMQQSLIGAWETLQQRGEQVRWMVERWMWANPEATGTQIGRMWVPIAASVIWWWALGLTKAGAWAFQTVKTGLATRSIPTVLKGIAWSSAVWWAETALYDVASKWEPTLKNTLIWATVWWGVAALPVLQKLVSNVWWWIYNFAFKQAQQKYLNQSATQFWKRAWDLVWDEWLKARSLKDAGKEIKSKLWMTWDTLKNQASKAWDLDVATLNTSMKTDLKWKMLKWLQPNTEFYKSVSDNVDDLVDFYIWKKWKIAWDKVIDLVKELNTQLPSGAFKKSELALNKAKTTTLIKWFKSWLQKYLDDEVWDITKLYWDYSRQKLISDILNDVQVKKMLWRSLLWATVFWVWAWWNDIASGNIPEWLKKAVIWAIIWWLITKTSTDPAFLYKAWRLLR